MFGLSGPGPSHPFVPPRPLSQAGEAVFTAEAGLSLDPLFDLRVEPQAQEGDRVIQGAPILRDRRRPELTVTAPMSGQVADLEIGAGRRLTSLILYGENNDDRHGYETAAANEEVANGKGSDSLRALLHMSGLWMRFRARPFGRVPAGEARPVSIFVMAVDTRPLAPDPRMAVDGEKATCLELGLRALSLLTDGTIHLCQDRGPDIVPPSARMRIEKVRPLHPAGLAGFCMHRILPARLDRSIWQIDAEDVVAIGHLLTEGVLPATRLVSIAGPGMREPRLVRCQAGADLRELCYAHMLPGQKTILSGSVLDGREARWLGFRDRQVTVIDRVASQPVRNWLGAALRQAARPEPIVPTAALEQAMGDYIPAVPLLRALSVGDDETVIELGGLSLLEEEMALVDYVTSATPRFSELLRASLNRIEENL